MFGTQVQRQARLRAEQIVRPLAALGLTPNMVSLIGFALTAVAAFVLAIGHLHLGGAFVLFAGIFDMFDGAVARVQQKTSVFGAFLDSTLDRYAEGILFLGLIIHASYFEPFASQQQLVVVLAFCGAILSLMVSYTRARAEGLGLDCKVGVMERPERVLLLGAGLLLGGKTWEVWILGILVATTAFTGLQRIAHVWRVSTVHPDKRVAP